ncbi:hypothetical protein ALDI51_44030 [Alicycliphilus denitrificans]|uniref:hypothetical protein n=1 Tax=Alicycliphilus denitrificans TaxID=179636 RepID=UPI001915A38E|nr:hypothetical protein [Alicycliphilus denitrificans]MBN9574392.1 hypothetical protein [Alicycliphilus denitrificans]BCN41084.1 hypothetical protein ALDI51_44030 [Alicycliphilus denitrificans]
MNITADTVIALVALLVSLLTFGASIRFWRRQFRPIVTAAIRTHGASNQAIAYNLVLLNSGTIPAKNIALSVDESTLVAALGDDATTENKTRWLACFSATPRIRILHNGDRTSCSFGTTQTENSGFWKNRATISITIKYDGWFGLSYTQQQVLEVVDSASFTGYMWGDGHA